MSLLLAGGPLLLAWGPLLLWSCAWAACVPRTRGGLVLFLGAVLLPAPVLLVLGMLLAEPFQTARARADLRAQAVGPHAFATMLAYVSEHPRYRWTLVDTAGRMQGWPSQVQVWPEPTGVTLLDVGPGAGEEGGTIVAAGTPLAVSQGKAGVTAPFLRRLFE